MFVAILGGLVVGAAEIDKFAVAVEQQGDGLGCYQMPSGPDEEIAELRAADHHTVAHFRANNARMARQEHDEPGGCPRLWAFGEHGSLDAAVDGHFNEFLLQALGMHRHGLGMGGTPAEQSSGQYLNL